MHTYTPPQSREELVTEYQKTVQLDTAYVEIAEQEEAARLERFLEESKNRIATIQQRARDRQQYLLEQITALDQVEAA
jgi:hypothetical protein